MPSQERDRHESDKQGKYAYLMILRDRGKQVRVRRKGGSHERDTDGLIAVVKKKKQMLEAEVMVTLVYKERTYQAIPKGWPIPKGTEPWMEYK